MAKKQKSRRRRAATPAQIAARKKFVEMVRSGKFGKKKKAKKAKKKAAAKKRAVKKAAHKVARKNPAPKRRRRRHAAKKHHAKHAKKHAKRAMRANPAKKRRRSRRRRHHRRNPFHAAMRMNARGPSKRALAQQAEGERIESMSQAIREQRMGEKLGPSRFRRGSRLAAMSPAERAAYKRKAKARKKNKKKIQAVRSRIKKINKAMKSPKASSSRKRILRARKHALNVHRSYLTGQISGSDRRVMEASNLMKVRNNPSFGEVFASLKTLAPQLGAHAVGLAGAAYVGQMAGDKLAAHVPSWMPGKEFVAKHAVSISTVGVALAAYEALKHMSPKTRPFAGAVLMGGVAAAFVHAAARMSTKEGKSTLGKDIGLPLGAMAAPAAVSGFIDVGGRALAVDGVGEYMSLAGNTLTGSSLGEYMALSGSTLTGSSLGEIGQMSEGRQGARALNSTGDVPVEDFFDDEEEDEGSLSGSIFDD